MNAKPLSLVGGTVLDVAARTLYRANVTLRDGLIAAVTPPHQPLPADAQHLDVAGRLVAPGFIDPHLHIESSLLSPLQFARAAVRHGTTAVFVDPHEIANVLGRHGIGLFLAQAPLLPLDLYVGVPSCVPATDLEDAGAEISLQDVAELLAHPRVFGLAEMMNYPGIVHGLGDARAKVALALDHGKIVDGHAPGLSGDALRTYVSNGHNDGQVRIMSDHECTTAAEAVEKHRAGMHIALRYGSATKDMARILPGLLRGAGDSERYMLCSDDLDPVELVREGHVDRIVRRARAILVDDGWDLAAATLEAVAMATLHPARYFAPFLRRHGLPPLGEVTPGHRANLVVLESLEALEAVHVVHGGRLLPAAAEDGAPFDHGPYRKPLALTRRFIAEDFALRHRGPSRTAEVKVIGLGTGLATHARTVACAVRDGVPVQPPDTAKIAVIERHRGTGTFSVGFVERCLRDGAIATTVAHDSHNIVVVGTDDEAMAAAVNHLCDAGGGMVAAGGTPTFLPLPVAGLMSDLDAETVGQEFSALRTAVQARGGAEDLLMRISFLALPVIPALRITNRGLVDVERFAFTALY